MTNKYTKLEKIKKKEETSHSQTNKSKIKSTFQIFILCLDIHNHLENSFLSNGRFILFISLTKGLSVTKLIMNRNSLSHFYSFGLS